MTRKSVLFDLDGVLIDSPYNHAYAWLGVLKPYGVQPSLTQIYREEGRKALDVAREWNREFNLGLTERQIGDLIDRKRQIYRSFTARGLTDSARRLIEELKRRNRRFGLVSGSARENVEMALTEKELELFDVIVTAEDYSNAKPHPEPFLTASRRMSVPPHDCIAVENAPLGIASAKAAGMYTIGLTSTLPGRELESADEIIDNLNSLSQILDRLEN